MFAVGVAVAYAAGWGWNGLFNLTVAQAGPLDVAATTGITQAGLLFGSVWGPLAFAILMNDLGPRSAWLLTACFVAVGAALFLYVRRRWLGALPPTVSSLSATLELDLPLV